MENLHWGEEIEYHLYSLDKDKHTVKLCCDAQQILKSLNSEQQKTNGFKPSTKLSNLKRKVVGLMKMHHY